MTEAEHADAVRRRFAATASCMAELEEARRADLRQRLTRFLEPRGDERVVDVGAGTGALALALAPLVREVVAVDLVPELVAEGRRRAAGLPNVTFLAAEGTRLPFRDGEFDVAATLRTLHHVPRPELIVAELARVTRLGGQVLIVDQIAPADPLLAVELDRFERARDPTHTRLLPDIDVRALLEANGLVLRRSEVVYEERDLERYLDLAGLKGEARQRARALAPAAQTVAVGWYLAARPAPRT